MAMTISRSEYFKYQGILDRCDIESNALSALVLAANNWKNYCESNGHDHTDLVHFARYASLRIRGSITDESRKNTFASRWNISDYQQARAVGLDRPISEIAAATGITESRIKNAISAIETDRSMRMSYELDDDDAVSEEPSDIGLVLEAIVDCIKSMPRTQQAIVALKYFKGMRIKDIAEELDVKSKHVAVLHVDAILKIRSAAIREML